MKRTKPDGTSAVGFVRSHTVSVIARTEKFHMMKMTLWFVVCFLFNLSVEAASLRIATFQIDVTPPIGSPLCDGLVPDAMRVDDPLFARGFVLLGTGEPIVLCAVDFAGIGNSGHDAWRETLARAAGTSPSRVAVQTLHQHDAPGCDFDAEELLVSLGIGGKSSDVPFLKDVLRRLEAAVKESLATARPFSQIGTGHAVVKRVASNRRILGEDGRVKIVRYSSTKDPEAMAAPEGTIDSDLKCLSFWNHETPLVSVTFYATHPQSHYGKGAVSSDFPGLARAERDRSQPGVFHLHFNGAGGNVAAGKYNNGSPEARIELTERLANGMKAAFENTKRIPVTSADIEWRTEPVVLPLRDRLQDLTSVEKVVLDEKTPIRERTRAARDIAYAKRVTAGRTIDLSSLRIGPVVILNLPGEIFVEYQLAAQAMRPDQFVCTTGYGDYGPGYIGTTISYSQGGYETSDVSRTAPEVEGVLLAGIRKLLK